MNPPDADDLAAELQLAAADDQCELCIEAAVRFVEKVRFKIDPVLLWRDPDVNKGALLYGALLYQAQAAPSGFPEYDEVQATYGASMAGIYRLVGGAPSNPSPAVA